MSDQNEIQDVECLNGLAFSEAECSRGMRMAIMSACFGAIAQTMVSDSSIMILYAGMLGGSRFVSMCTTSLQSISLFVLYIPLAYFVGRLGKKKMILPAIGIGVAGLLLTVFAPFFGSSAAGVLLVGLAIFSIAMAVYLAAWFPLLRDIVPADARGRFFGTMRFRWQGCSAVFLILSAMILKWNSSMAVLQGLVVVAALLLIGRLVCIARIPETPLAREVKPLGKSLRAILSDSRLMGFGTYLFWLYAFAGATVPVVIIFAKLKLKFNDDFLVLLSSCLLIGSIVGFLIGGKMVDRQGTKKVFLLAHFTFGLLNLLMLTVQNNSTFCTYLLIGIVSMYGLIFAAATIAVSSEAFALAPEEFSEMGLAVCLGLYYAGLGFSRFLAGWVLDSGMLAESWNLWGIDMSQYHTLFFFFGIGVLVTCVLLVMVPVVVTPSKSLPQVR